MKGNGMITAIRTLCANELLGALIDYTGDQTWAGARLVSLAQGEVLHDAGCDYRYAYFPNDAIVSVVSTTRAGKSVETAIVGSEGVVGIDAILGGKKSCIKTEVQSPGTACRVPVQLLMNEFNQSPQLRMLILGYMQSVLAQMAQMAVCNRLHSIEQQFCRRLLCSLDRVPGDEVVLTQGMMANLLGVRREGVTDAAGRLRRLGVISSRRGRIKVLDRGRLEKLSCECYAVVKADSDFLAVAAAKLTGATAEGRAAALASSGSGQWRHARPGGDSGYAYSR